MAFTSAVAFQQVSFYFFRDGVQPLFFFSQFPAFEVILNHCFCSAMPANVVHKSSLVVMNASDAMFVVFWVAVAFPGYSDFFLIKHLSPEVALNRLFAAPTHSKK